MQSNIIKSGSKSSFVLMKSNMTELYILVPKGPDGTQRAVVVHPGTYVSSDYQIGDRVMVETKYFTITQDAVSICN